MAVKSCTSPALSVTVIVTSVPCGTPVVVPVNGGVALLVSPATVTVISGAVKSILATAWSIAWLPAASTATALTLNSPSAKGDVVVILQLPCASTCVTIVCCVPVLSVRVTETLSPVFKPATEPVTVTV